METFGGAVLSQISSPAYTAHSFHPVPGFIPSVPATGPGPDALLTFTWPNLGPFLPESGLLDDSAGGKPDLSGLKSPFC